MTEDGMMNVVLFGLDLGAYDMDKKAWMNWRRWPRPTNGGSGPAGAEAGCAGERHLSGRSDGWPKGGCCA